MGGLMVKQAVPDSIADSSICRALEVFQGKWNAWVLYTLRTNGEMRFGELRRSIPGISNTMLSTTLKALEAKGLVSRKQIEGIPPCVIYSLTQKAEALRDVFAAMIKWGSEYP